MTINITPQKQAVCFLLMNEQGDILAITRKNNKKQWGLPGGKVEANESLDVAVVRETFEETGYVVAAPQSVYTALVPGGRNFMCTTFVGTVVAQAKDAPRSEPYEGDVKWVRPGVLAAGPYAKYNQALFDHLNIHWDLRHNTPPIY